MCSSVEGMPITGIPLLELGFSLGGEGVEICYLQIDVDIIYSIVALVLYL